MLRHFLRPRWLAFHLLVVTGGAVMAFLGFWQLDRFDQRQDFNTEVSSRIDAEPVRVAAAFPADGNGNGNRNGNDLEWTPVFATGTYLADEQVLVVNRSQDGVAGQNVVTPLLLDDGRLLLVNRGFVPLASDVPSAPAGTSTVAGVLRASQERGFAGARDPSDGRLTEVQRIDVDRLSDQLPGEVLPLWLSLEASEPPLGASPVPLPRPALSSGPHLGYAVQWFIFAVCVVIGWVLAVRRSAQTYRNREISAGTPTPPSS